jgi:hypothetical protein
LSHLPELCILDTSSCASVHAAMDHQMCSILVLLAIIISLDDDIPT